jgi:hypothetical protein
VGKYDENVGCSVPIMVPTERLNHSRLGTVITLGALVKFLLLVLHGSNKRWRFCSPGWNRVW